jgi:hypothetical protein
MAELEEKRWAVISERGCEGANLTYKEALELEQLLIAQKVYGLCIVTQEAARRAAAPESQESRGGS